jgi:hypothetical protein
MNLKSAKFIEPAYLTAGIATGEPTLRIQETG